MSVSSLLRTTQPALSFCRNLNCWTAAITKKHRSVYERTYPTALVLPDGSSINVDYHVPRKIIILPLDLNTVPEWKRKQILEMRKKKTKVKIQEDIVDSFDASKYYRNPKKAK